MAEILLTVISYIPGKLLEVSKASSELCWGKVMLTMGEGYQREDCLL